MQGRIKFSSLLDSLQNGLGPLTLVTLVLPVRKRLGQGALRPLRGKSGSGRPPAPGGTPAPALGPLRPLLTEGAAQSYGLWGLWFQDPRGESRSGWELVESSFPDRIEALACVGADADAASRDSY